MKKTETRRLEKYEKPQINEIELKADQVLGTGCKFAASPMAGVGYDFGCGHPMVTNCAAEGT